ncbi:MAG: hypothetical protein RR047_00070 [Bacilli bacterium]
MGTYNGNGTKKESKTITDYENTKTYSSSKTIKLYKGSLLIVFIVGIILMITFGLRAYQISKIDPFEKKGSTLAQEYFLESAKTYFEFDPNKLPTSIGNCTTVALKTVQEQNLISDIKFYNKCDKDVSLVKVCKLESGNYHFEVNMACENSTNIAYSGEKELTDEKSIASKSDVKVLFSYQAEKLDTNNSYFGEKQTMWQDEIPYVNYKIVKETTYYRFRDKNWRWKGDIRYYYPEDKSNTELVKEYYKDSPHGDYKFKEVSQNLAYKWYVLNDDKSVKHYYPSGSTTSDMETTYYLTAPIKDAVRDDATKTYAAKYYRVASTTASEYLPAPSSSSNVKIIDTENWSNWSLYSLSIPEYAPFGPRNREIETRIKTEIIPITTETESEVMWNKITNSYVSENELVSELRKLGYTVNNLDDISKLPDIKYAVKQTYKEPQPL